MTWNLPFSFLIENILTKPFLQFIKILIAASTIHGTSSYITEAGTSTRPCSDIYTGETPFSEPETQILRDQILQYADNGIVYLTFHSALEQFLRPYGYDLNVPAENNDEHVRNLILVVLM